ncbi:hypothetical protein BC828DRAFT_388863 [Blastocladiella britannica]|nr:hypothetical protein BC828DRAFT_388863 [Blastocladiella britannica]
MQVRSRRQWRTSRYPRGRERRNALPRGHQQRVRDAFGQGRGGVHAGRRGSWKKVNDGSRGRGRRMDSACTRIVGQRQRVQVVAAAVQVRARVRREAMAGGDRCPCVCCCCYWRWRYWRWWYRVRCCGLLHCINTIECCCCCDGVQALVGRCLRSMRVGPVVRSRVVGRHPRRLLLFHASTSPAGYSSVYQCMKWRKCGDRPSLARGP